MLRVPLRGSRQYGITCTALTGATPCGWDDFTTDTTAAAHRQVGGRGRVRDDHYVCNPGQRARRRAGSPPSASGSGAGYGFAAVKFDVDLDGGMFFPCPRGR